MKKQIKEDFEEKLAELTRKYGKGSIIKADNNESYGDIIPVTSFSLANALGIKGFAKRKLYTIDGASSAGKSTTAYDVIGNCQKTYGDTCLLIDKEDSYTKSFGARIGIDNSKLIIARPKTLEDMHDLIIDALNSKMFGCIVADSVTAFAPAAKYEGSATMGLEARVNSDKMRLVMDALEKSDCCLIMLQQIRNSIGGYGDPTCVSGGLAIPFYASVRIRITRSEIDRENQQNVMKFTIIKNKLSEPFKVGTVVYDWNAGFDTASEMGDLAMEFGIITKEKTTYTFPDSGEYKVVGKKAVVQYLKDNPEYIDKVLKPLVIEYLQSNTLRPEDAVEDISN